MADNFIPFREWKFERVQRTFGLKREFDYPLLKEWEAATHAPSERDRQTLEELRQELVYTIDTLNEEELKFYFLGPLLRLIPFRSHGRRPFLDRYIEFTFGENQRTGGRVDWMLADGIQDPHQPYFFLHEYKRELDSSGDPLGQVLIAMVAAQQRNEHAFPLYGSYVAGRNWFFVVLEKDRYAVSLSMDVTKSDILKIYAMLTEAQHRITKIEQSLAAI